MKMSLARDDTVHLDLDVISRGLGKLISAVTFRVEDPPIKFAEEVIESPSTYERLQRQIGGRIAADDLAVIFTNKPYSNNFFWDSPSNKPVVISLYGWEDLTPLPRNNGAAYFSCALLVRALRIGSSHQDRNTGCINDFWLDKRGVDSGMRSAFLCETCSANQTKKRSAVEAGLVAQIQLALDDVSAASRHGKDVCDMWRNRPQKGAQFDVFLCHNSTDKNEVRKINEVLTKKSIHTWLDEEQLPPGRIWQQLLEEQISSIRSAAVFVGGSGIGPWQNVEIRGFLQEFVQRDCPVIPVILASCKEIPPLPLFLKNFTWIDFRRKTPDPTSQLIWGITGVKQSPRRS